MIIILIKVKSIAIAWRCRKLTRTRTRTQAPPAAWEREVCAIYAAAFLICQKKTFP